MLPGSVAADQNAAFMSWAEGWPLLLCSAATAMPGLFTKSAASCSAQTSRPQRLSELLYIYLPYI